MHQKGKEGGQDLSPSLPIPGVQGLSVDVLQITVLTFKDQLELE